METKLIRIYEEDYPRLKALMYELTGQNRAKYTIADTVRHLLTQKEQRNMSPKTFDNTALRQAVTDALDNWNFDLDYLGDCKRKIALETIDVDSMTHDEPWELPAGFKDVYDWLSEYTDATSADMSEDYARRYMRHNWK